MNVVRGSFGVASIAAAAVLLAACGGGGSGGGGGGGGAAMGYVASTQVADTSAVKTTYSAAQIDANLVNPWGIAFNPTGFVWVANQGTSTTTLYNGAGVAQPAYAGAPLSITVAGSPTGVVYNSSIGGSNAFVMPDSQPALFIYATLAGTIEAWDTAAAAAAVQKASVAGAVYTGLALGHDSGGSYFLYAADFKNGLVDVFDNAFTQVTTAGIFTAPAGIPAGYAPYGIQNIPAADGSAQIYVAYAQQGASGHAATGAGLGYVAVFDAAGMNGKLLISAGSLNAPWGMTLAPAAGFGPFSGALLVGNFGDGQINAYNATTGALMGTLSAPSGTAFHAAGLWGIAFGNGINGQPTTTLYFAAGVNSEADGVYGSLTYGAAPAGGGGGGGY